LENTRLYEFAQALARADRGLALRTAQASSARFEFGAKRSAAPQKALSLEI
jgi:hypothetical protein